jgi:putative ABC transport system permease protein
MSQIIGSFTLIAILISCLGLYGLSAFVAERKVKEIGIRKVLGAQVSSIVGLLSRDFTQLVLIAFLLSVPLSYYIMNQWLQNFAYRIDIGPQFFIVAGVLALIIAWFTVSYHAIRAALANPVKSLRSE